MFYSSLAIGSALNAAAQTGLTGSAAEARKAATDVENLKYDVERLLMISEALWTILKEKHGYDDNELIRRVAEIDLRDGKLDGKLAKEPPVECPNCHRPMMKHRPICMYCGKPVAVNPFER
jgi:hypothetical protein